MANRIIYVNVEIRIVSNLVVHWNCFKKLKQNIILKRFIAKVFSIKTKPNIKN
jgi:hypothetical protein